MERFKGERHQERMIKEYLSEFTELSVVTSSSGVDVNGDAKG